MSSPQYKVGFTTLAESQPFSVIVREGIQAAAAQHPEIELIIRDNDMDNERALANAQEFANIPVDLAIIYHVDERFNPQINRVLMQHQIPVIAIDIPIPLTIYFGANNKQAGILAGEELGKWIKANWDGHIDKIIVPTDSRVLEVVRQRLDFALKGLADYTDYNSDHVFFLDGANNRQVCAERSRAVLENWADFHHIAVVGLNDDLALGVLDAAKALGREHDMIAVGQGATLLGEAFSQPDGRFLGSVAYFPDNYGKHLIDLSLRILRGERVPRENFIEHVCITRDNVHLLHHQA